MHGRVVIPVLLYTALCGAMLKFLSLGERERGARLHPTTACCDEDGLHGIMVR